MYYNTTTIVVQYPFLQCNIVHRTFEHCTWVRNKLGETVKKIWTTLKIYQWEYIFMKIKQNEIHFDYDPKTKTQNERKI